MVRQRNRAQRGYNVKGDSWFALGQDPADQDEDEGDAPSASRRGDGSSAGASRGPTGASRRRDAVTLLEDDRMPADPSTPGVQRRDLLGGGVEERPMGSEHGVGPPSEASTWRRGSQAGSWGDERDSLTLLLDRFGRWGGMGLDAEVIEAVYEELGRNSAAASAALQELSASLPGPSTRAAPPVVSAEPSPLQILGGGAVPASSVQSRDSGSQATAPQFDPSGPNGGDLWQGLPPDCQLHILGKLDVKHLAGLAMSCQACCQIVRELRARVTRIALPAGFTPARAARMIAAHPNLAQLTFNKRLTDFTALFQATCQPGRKRDVTGAPNLLDSASDSGTPPFLEQSYARPTLTWVSLSGCRSLNDYDVRQLLELQPTLLHLDLSNCVLLTDDSLAALAEHPRRGAGNTAVDATGWPSTSSPPINADAPSATLEWSGEAPAKDPQSGLPTDLTGDSIPTAGQSASAGKECHEELPMHEEGQGRASSKEGLRGMLPWRGPPAYHPLTLARGDDGAMHLRPLGAQAGASLALQSSSPTGGLRFLNLAGCSLISDSGLMEMLRGKHMRSSLQQLDVSRCPQVARFLLNLPARSALTRLVANHLPGLTAFLQLTSLPPHLQHLSLTHSPALPALTLHSRSLVTLALDSCLGLAGAVVGCPSLTSLSLSHCRALTSLSAPKCSELRTLNLAHCRVLPHDSITDLLAAVPRLEHLDCTACDELSFIQLRGTTHQSLRTLVLDGCRAVAGVVISSPLLETLSARNARALERVTLSSLNLKELLLSNCDALTSLELRFPEMISRAQQVRPGAPAEMAIASGVGDYRQWGANAEASGPAGQQQKPPQRIQIDINGCNRLPDFVYRNIKVLRHATKL